MGGRGGSAKRVATVAISGSAGFTQASPDAKPVTQLSVDGATPQQVATVQQAQRNNNAKFSDTDDQDYHQLYNGRQYFSDQSLSIDQRVATMNYLSDQPSPGSMYSMSQNMNYKLGKGLPLNANEQYTYNNLMSSMHNLGYNLNLTRYDHEGSINSLLSQVGVKGDYASMSESQLNKALTGLQFKSKALLSTSYNDFSKAGGNANTFTSRAVRIEYKAKAKTQAMMPGNGPGGRMGEIILGNTNSFKITGVKFDGRKTRLKGTQSYVGKGVTLYVDVE